MGMDLNQYGAWLAGAMARRGIIPRDLARKSGIMPDVLSKILSGRTALPELATHRSLCDALGYGYDGTPLEEQAVKAGLTQRYLVRYKTDESASWHPVVSWADFAKLCIGEAEDGRTVMFTNSMGDVFVVAGVPGGKLCKCVAAKGLDPKRDALIFQLAAPPKGKRGRKPNPLKKRRAKGGKA